MGTTTTTPVAGREWVPEAACVHCGLELGQSPRDGLWYANGDHLRIGRPDYCGHTPVEAAPVDSIADDAAVGGHAYGVTFRRGDARGASIVVWTYAMQAPPDVPGAYQIGFMCEYRFRFPDVIDSDEADWVLVAWSEDPEFYFSLSDCEAAAREAAEIMAAGHRCTDGDPAADWEFFFDWEGTPA